MCRHHLDGMIVDAPADDVGIEAAGRAVAEVRAQLLDQQRGRVQVEPVAAVRPERELDQALEHAEVAGRGRVGLGQEVDRELRHGAAVLLERETDVYRMPGLPGALLERAPDERRWTEQRVQLGGDAGDGRATPELRVS